MVTESPARQVGAGVDRQRPAIRLDRLNRWFGSTRAVDHVSFEVRAGEVFGFIGPNGAGKTTSMRILATLDVPTSGDAFVSGFSVVNDPDQVRRRLGFMPDGFGTYPNVNCEEYLDFFARAYGLRGNDRLRALRYVMGFTQLDALAQKPIDGLSKGMKQRLCLGRTLIHDPEVLVLDEPAAGLDPRARIELRDMILALAAEGKSLLISSHILSELATMCDRVAIIEQGRLLAVGSVDEILSGEVQVDGDESDQPSGLQANVAVEVGLLGDPEPVREWLAARDEVAEVRVVSGQLKMEVRGGREVQADLLGGLVAAGFRITSYTPRQRSLEDAFLHVTRGRVQ